MTDDDITPPIKRPRKARTGPTELSPRQLEFVRHYVVLGNASEAFKRSNYKAKNVSNSANNLMKNPLVQKAIAEAREKAKEQTCYGLVQAMEESRIALEFAMVKGQAMAVVKATELRARLSGLLIERHQVDLNVVSIDNALRLAGDRVMPFFLEGRTPTEEPREVIEAAEVSGVPDDAKNPV